MAEINGITSPEAINIATRGQVLLERLKSGQAAKFAPFLKRMEVILRMRLAAGDMTSYQAAKVTALLQSIEGDLTAVMGEYRTMLTGDLIDTAIQQAQFEAKTLDHLVTEKAFESFVPTAEQVRSAVLTAPLSVVGYNQGQLLESWLQNWSAGQIEQISGVIRQRILSGPNDRSDCQGAAWHDQS